ncbi:hypothetical protein H109_02393 [Trichophyton interdigitale MR816]|uniref:Glycosyl transferase CAP10 domain-containing protein n=1 Tax=Trichophyton interdigitale (strain MR816) TaxID=1215338 RepID=A0A059JDN9_TRIIM|nr:hypothetical protein H101_04103 [Trichophyton interdigitale H6]KDB25763.1 hypothetical protein H109_02393 [Trichophyton interdigitale MR816]
MPPSSPRLIYTWLGYLSAVGAALLAAAAKPGEHYEKLLHDLPAAWLCWVILCIYYIGKRYLLHGRFFDGDGLRGRDLTSFARLWAASIAVVAFIFASSLSGEASWLLPVITTIVHVIFLLREKRSLLSPSDSSPGDFIPKGWPSFAQLTGPAAVLLSLVDSVFLFRQSGDLNSSPLPSILRLSAWICLGWWTSNSIRSTTTSEGADVTSSLSHGVTPRVLFVLTVSLALRGHVPSFTPVQILVSLLSASKWIAIFSLVSGNGPASASTLDSFALFSAQAINVKQTNEFPVLFLSAAVALVQGVIALPKATRHQNWLALLLLIPLAGIVRQEASIDLGYSLWDGTVGRVADVPIHPIQQLVSDALKMHQDMVAGQSKTLEAAIKEYERRYGRKPPPGFDVWYKAATQQGFILVDEFNSLMEGLEPFWGVPPAVLRARVAAATQISGSRLIRYSVRNRNLVAENDGEATWITNQLRLWFTPEVLDTVPDIMFALNLLDEPRVVVPFDELMEAQSASKSNGSVGLSESFSETVEFEKANSNNMWDSMTLSCDPKSAARKGPSRFRLPHKGLASSFVSNTSVARDVCSMPDLQIQHGFFIAPETASIAHSIVPIFSQARPSSFQDILLPSVYYGAKLELHEYQESQDMKWDEKENVVYWAGSSTGGHTNIENWHTFHRQRLVLVTSHNTTRVRLMKKVPRPPSKGGNTTSTWRTYTSKMGQIASKFKIRISAVIQCEQDACDAQEAAFRPDEYPKDDFKATYRARYNLDVDGNGFSGRYLRGLLSNSAMMKQTIFKEWIDDWLTPWLHYIPVNMDLVEFPELIRFFTSEPEGQEIGKRIAMASKDWAQKTIRTEDLTLALWRVMLEYSRIMKDDRDSLQCCS